MEYLLFTYPHCPQCEDLKECLQQIPLSGQEYSLVLKESKMRIREFLKVLKRDSKGGIIIPTMIIKDEDQAPVVLNSRRELEEWWKSRD